jgi:hemolysin activation/secretion protein
MMHLMPSLLTGDRPASLTRLWPERRGLPARALLVGVGCLVHATLSSAQTPGALNDPAGLMMQDHLKRIEQAAPSAQPQSPPATAVQPPSVPRTEGTVQVNEIQFSKSELLAAADLQAAGQRYVGRRLATADIQQLLQEVSDLYQARGILTGVPVLPQQDLQTGVMRILLVEGRLGEVKVAEPGLAQADWVKRWFDLANGAVLTQEALRQRLLRFNSVSDFSATADMVAGAQFGQTDLSIAVNDASRVQTWGFYERSNADQTAAPAQLAAGLRVAPFSAQGGRLDLSLLSTKAGRTVSGAVGFPLGVQGWRTSLSASAARSESQVKGTDDAELTLKGESSALTWDVSRAWVLSAPWLAGTSVSLSRHHSKTLLDSSDAPLLDRRTDKLAWLGSLEYDTPRQRASLRGTFNLGSDVGTYRYAEITGQWRQALDEPGVWQFKAMGLLRLKPSGTLSSLDRFYLGGQDTVRGYSLGSASGDHGASAQLEVRRNLSDAGLASGEAYAFMDLGTAKDPAKPASDRLRSTGLGAQFKVNDTLGLDVLASRQLAPQLTSPTRLLVRLVLSH